MMYSNKVKIMKHLHKLLIIFSVVSLIISGCDDNDHSGGYSSQDSVFIFIDDVMDYWYYWYEEIPDLDIFGFETPSDLLEAMMYTPPDYWSFIEKAEIVESLYEDGEYLGFGFLLKFDVYGNLRIPLVYENSEAYELGIRRGNIITAINGTDPTLFDDYNSFFDYDPETFTFEILDNEGIMHTITLDKSIIVQNGVIFSDIYNVSGTKTGYILYDSFLNFTKEELEDVISYFKSNDITELVIDLRYNGGGYISLAKELCEMIMPAETAGKVFISFLFNDRLSETHNSSFLFEENELNLDLDRVFFITTGASASASELVINSLEPYMDVLIIGTFTHGKPVGMSEFTFNDWVLYPVVTQMVNAEGFGDYFEGLIPDCEAEDGMDHEWGDETEPCLYQAFHYISYGTWDNMITASTKTSDTEMIPNQYWKNRNLLILDN
jgi:C-terminal processing protease CtpA/Prc